MIDVGTVTAASRTVVDGKTATTRVRVEVDGLDALGGVLHVDGIVTDLVVISDGEKATTKGGTTVTGATVLGLPAVIDAEGVRFEGDGPGGAPAPLAPVGGALGPVAGLSPGVAAVLAGDPTGLQKALAEAGISVRVARPEALVEGPGGSLRSAGMVIDLSGDLQATPLAQLLDLVPGLPEAQGAPFQANDVVAIAKANHISSIGIGAARAAASARPLVARSSTGSISGSSGGSLGGGFEPGFGAPSGSASTGGARGGEAVGTQRPIAQRLPLGDLVGWRLVVLALAGAFLASLGTRKLPDWALAAGGERCTLSTTRDRTIT